MKKLLSDKEQKKKFKQIASKNPEKYYPVSVLYKEGFSRKQCSNCGTFFWTTDPKREVCGDPACSGGFDVVENNPSKNKLSFIGVWKKIVEILEPRGYKPIKRYPVVARWNPTVEFTIASIAAFQPYVITGESEPPAKMLVIPQFCLRFGDIENVGITGSHCTGFVMIGQHVFVSPEEWDQARYFKDIYDFLIEGVGLSKDEFVIHEDAWAGGGSYGPCLEFFSRGVELFNQVYTMFEQTPEGDRELKLKVLDMGLGQERVAWFSQGTPNIYEATFPEVLKKLKQRTKINTDLELFKRFSKYSAYLNVDEVDDMDKAWGRVADELKMDVEDLKGKILPMTGIYSVAEHSRALLFAISDGKLPSNVGGGYNLRAIFRRAVSFIDQFKWDIKINEVCRWHAEELYELFPEVSEHLEEVDRILDVEYRKYYATKKKAKKIISKILEKDNIDEETLIKLYDSQGISPEMVIEEAKKIGKFIKKPDNFYNKIIELHEQKEQIHQTHVDIDVKIPESIPDTKIGYWEDYLKLSTNAKVLFIQKGKVNGKNKWIVITDETIAYPTSGGQLHDIGTINGIKFDDVVKYKGYILHCLIKKPNFKVGDIVEIKVDEDWRKQLAAHHTATHIINAASRIVLGEHVNQASAKKTYEKAQLDITHYDNLSEEEIRKIENTANEIISKDYKINFYLLPRSEAEAKYGMRLYQGGAVPGKVIRIVEIPNIDVEACGGTHMHHTGEIEHVKIIKTQKVQDGIIRLIFTGGNAVKKLEIEQNKILDKIAQILKIKKEQIISQIQNLIQMNKKLNKAIIKTSVIDGSLTKLPEPLSQKISTFDAISKLTQMLNVPQEQLIDATEKLITEYYRLKNIALEGKSSKDIEKEIIKINNKYELLIKDYSGLNAKEINKLSQNIVKDHPKIIFVALSITSKGIIISSLIGEDLVSNNFNITHLMKEIISKFNGKGGGRNTIFQGLIPLTKNLDPKQIIKKLKVDLEKIIQKL
ncbi:MAG: alanine--tRNA ligase [Promethearchaeota archaeon]